MEKCLAAIEITNREVRLVVGDVINDKPVVLFQTSRPITGLVSRGDILDPTTLSQIIASLAVYQDETSKKRIIIKDVTLILPPSGLSVFQTDKTTNVVSQSSIIDKLDIRNVISLVQKEAIPAGNTIVDIIPDVFITEGDKKFSMPPMGEKSNFLTIHAKVHALPTRVVEQYRKVVENAKIRALRLFVSPYAIIELAKQKNDIPPNYFLVDMGAEMSHISLVGNHSLYASTTFVLGGDDLIKYVSEEFVISEDEAREIVELYGINERQLSFKPVISTSFINGVEVSYTPDDLNRVIIDFFVNSYFKQFDVAMNNLIREYSNASSLSIPIVFTGGFSRLHGFDKLAKEKFINNQSIHFLESEVIGARGANCCATIGAIIASSKYKGSLSDQRARVTQVERVDNEQD